MNQDGNLNNLAGRMREKIRKEQIQTEEAVANSFQTLSKNLQELSKKEANTIHSVMSKNVNLMTKRLNQESKLLNWTFVIAWVRTGLIGIALSIGMCIGLWLTVDWLADGVSSNLRRLNNIKEEISTQEESLEILQAETFGITLIDHENRQFIAFPHGMTVTKKIATDGKEFIELER